jgi:hypothetical protein
VEPWSFKLSASRNRGLEVSLNAEQFLNLDFTKPLYDSLLQNIPLWQRLKAPRVRSAFHPFILRNETGYAAEEATKQEKRESWLIPTG